MPATPERHLGSVNKFSCGAEHFLIHEAVASVETKPLPSVIQCSLFIIINRSLPEGKIGVHSANRSRPQKDKKN